MEWCFSAVNTIHHGSTEAAQSVPQEGLQGKAISGELQLLKRWVQLLCSTPAPPETTADRRSHKVNRFRRIFKKEEVRRFGGRTFRHFLSLKLARWVYAQYTQYGVVLKLLWHWAAYLYSLCSSEVWDVILSCEGENGELLHARLIIRVC